MNFKGNIEDLPITKEQMINEIRSMRMLKYYLDFETPSSYRVKFYYVDALKFKNPIFLEVYKN